MNTVPRTLTYVNPDTPYLPDCPTKRDALELWDQVDYAARWAWLVYDELAKRWGSKVAATAAKATYKRLLRGYTTS